MPNPTLPMGPHGVGPAPRRALAALVALIAPVALVGLVAPVARSAIVGFSAAALVALPLPVRAAEATLVGAWILTEPTPGGIENTRFVVGGSAGAWVARLSARMPSTIKDLVIDGARFSFTRVAETPMGEIVLKYRGTVSGATFKGEVDTPFGANEFTGKRAE